MNSLNLKFKILSLLFYFTFSLSIFSQSGAITGRITDASDNSPMWGTNIYVKGTTIGTTSDAEGRYRLAGIPQGKAVIIYRYLGYQADTVKVDIIEGNTVNINLKLKPEAIRGDEIIVTAQLQGQQAAINQQLNSNTIVNIVSSDKIQALPDANVAESIGRLPGISVERDAGEGSKVVVRGLSPKFNSITINGERIPATDPNDRSVDLSMISQDILAGIEVFKALTPDKDADAIGGTINLVTKSAAEELKFDVRTQGGYNNKAKDFGQYKFTFSGSNRFIDKKLGLLASFSAQKTNRSSDVLNAAYIGGTSQKPKIEISDLYLVDRIETRNRYSAGLNLDYNLGNGSILLNNFFSRTERDETRRRKSYRVDAFRTEYDLRDREINTSVFSSNLNANYSINSLLLNAQFSYSLSKQETPYSNYARFQELGAFKNGLVVDEGPGKIPQFAYNNLGATWFQYGTFNLENINDKDLTGQFDLKLPVAVGDEISGFIKGGVKYRDKHRDRYIHEYRTDYGITDTIAKKNPGRYDLYQGHILFTNFSDPRFEADDFLDGKYTFGPGLDVNKIDGFYDEFKSYYQLNSFTELNNYKAGEKITSTYIMAQLDLFKDFMLLPGFRYEQTKTDYNGKYGTLKGNLGQVGTVIDSLGGQNYHEFLPMVHLRYKVLDGFDVRFAYTESISRPDYFNLVPYRSINEAEQLMSLGNPDLKHTTATNYDLFFSFYNNYGLFTSGLYYKKLKNIDYISQYRVTNGQFNGYWVTQPVNSPEAKVYGAEIDVQTNFLFLPAPLDGIILNVNVSRIYSETFFPFFEIGPRSTTPPYQPIIINDFRKGRMPGQADWIYNITFGYEKGGFSGRVSFLHQGQMLQTVGSRSELDGYTKSYTRVDVSASQDLFSGFSIYTNINNVTNVPDGAFLGTQAFATNEEYFGWTLDLGLHYKF
jgi:TonB-dependent receptor